jgi:hypothetical protein
MRASLILAALLLSVLFAPPAVAQQPPAFTPEMEETFRRLSAELAAARLDGDDTEEDEEEQALQLLDALVLAGVSAPEPDLAALNRRLDSLAAVPVRVGESYHLARLGPRAQGVRYYVLGVNFGFAGPAAARVYSCRDDDCRLAGSVDADYDAELFDENLVVHALDTEEPVFVLITGRTDELSTGAFAAWRFTSAGLDRLWAVELSPRAEYEALPDGIRVRYCAEPDLYRPETCVRTARESWAWRNGAWRQLPEPPGAP